MYTREIILEILVGFQLVLLQIEEIYIQINNIQNIQNMKKGKIHTHTRTHARTRTHAHTRAHTRTHAHVQVISNDIQDKQTADKQTICSEPTN